MSYPGYTDVVNWLINLDFELDSSLMKPKSVLRPKNIFINGVAKLQVTEDCKVARIGIISKSNPVYSYEIPYRTKRQRTIDPKILYFNGVSYSSIHYMRVVYLGLDLDVEIHFTDNVPDTIAMSLYGVRGVDNKYRRFKAKTNLFDNLNRSINSLKINSAEFDMMVEKLKSNKSRKELERRNRIISKAAEILGSAGIVFRSPTDMHEFLIRSMKYKNHISDDIFFLENLNEALDSLYDELNANIVLKL